MENSSNQSVLSLVSPMADILPQLKLVGFYGQPYQAGAALGVSVLPLHASLSTCNRCVLCGMRHMDTVSTFQHHQPTQQPQGSGRRSSLGMGQADASTQ